MVPSGVLSTVADRSLEGIRVGTVHRMVVAVALCNQENMFGLHVGICVEGQTKTAFL